LLSVAWLDEETQVPPELAEVKAKILRRQAEQGDEQGTES
jgi:hypothetical protein